MNDQHDHLRMVYIGMAAIAGSVTALSFMKWREMTWPEIIMTLIVGFSFAIFFVPWLAADWMHIDINNLRAVCAVVYLGGMSSNALMPVLIKRAMKAVGSGDAA